jgi:hypothetical protein
VGAAAIFSGEASRHEAGLRGAVELHGARAEPRRRGFVAVNQFNFGAFSPLADTPNGLIAEVAPR